MTQGNHARQELDLELTNMKRNPYLADYQEYRKAREYNGAGRATRERVTQERIAVGQTTRRRMTQERPAQDRAAAGQASRRRAEQERIAQDRAAAGQTLRRRVEPERATQARPLQERMTGERMPQGRAGGYPAGNGRRPAQPGVRNVPNQRRAPGRAVQYETVKPAARQTQGDRYRMAAKRKARIRRQRQIMALVSILILTCSVVLLLQIFRDPEVDGAMAPENNPADSRFYNYSDEKIQGISAEDYAAHPSWTENFLTVNEYSRPGDELKEVNNIFVHYTANPGTSAAQNRSYFEQLKDNHERSASAHFIIGYEGEIIQCIPLDEIAYAVMTRNEDSISIECCYLAEDGSFTQETYDSLIALLKWLTDTYDLDANDILRHYDCGGKKCPIYYTEHEDAWERLREDVKTL